jgi:hypothetical protein
MSEMERIILADETLPFATGGTMRPAFNSKSAGWERAVQNRMEAKNIGEAEATQELRKEREVELLAMVDWIHAGAKEKDYSQYILSPEAMKKVEALKVKTEELPEQFFEISKDKPITAKVMAIMTKRCARCHDKGRGEEEIPLKEWKDVKAYCNSEVGSGLSLPKLVQSTHLHLLSFAMLYGLTGLIFAFSSYPAIIRLVIAPLPLVAQIADIACWWLARTEAPFGTLFAQGIIVTGGLVGLGLGLHIVLGLLNMYGMSGKLIVVLMLLAGGVIGWQAKERYVGPFLAKEKAGTTVLVSGP